MRWFAYLHPLLMLVGLLLGSLALREGLALRRARLARNRQDPAGHRRAHLRHRRLGRGFAWVVAVGYPAGVSSMIWLQPRPALESVHFVLATLAASAVVTAAVLGRQLERRPLPDRRTVHALFGTLGLLIALGAAAAGMAILP